MNIINVINEKVSYQENYEKNLLASKKEKAIKLTKDAIDEVLTKLYSGNFEVKVSNDDYKRLSFNLETKFEDYMNLQDVAYVLSSAILYENINTFYENVCSIKDGSFELNIATKQDYPEVIRTNGWILHNLPINVRVN